MSKEDTEAVGDDDEEWCHGGNKTVIQKKEDAAGYVVQCGRLLPREQHL
jgi:hypothetical protein